MKEKFYITTPIYYWNGSPHIWHLYTSTLANVIFKYHKISSYDSRFTTWIDENSQKIVEKAKSLWLDVMDFLDEMSIKHKEMWDYFDIKYTDFIRTTEERHHKLVREVLQKCYDKWDIYEWVYEWMYCVGCEAFKKDEDLIEKNWVKVCPDHLTQPEYLKEKNYFFKLSKYQTWLEEFYEKNPLFVLPDFRYNEVKAFTKRWLEDFSISRETNTFWIPLPFDERQVTYVWFDALFNYYTSCKYSRWWDKNNNNFVDESNFWIKEDKNQKILHTVWKDIIRFHAIFWPCMLASYFDLWEEKNEVIHYKDSDINYLPNNILTWWYFTVDWQKMSKTIWNVIDPIEFTNKYNKEILTLYLLSVIYIWSDWDFSEKDAVLMYNSKLANNFWNLVNRAVVLTLKLELQEALNWKIDDSIKDKLEKYNEIFNKSMESYLLKDALDFSFKFLDDVNLYITEKEPWNKMKDEKNIQEVINILYTICESIRQVSLNLYSFFPEKMTNVFGSLALKDYTKYLEEWKLEELKNKTEVFNIKNKTEILFQKFDI